MPVLTREGVVLGLRLVRPVGRGGEGEVWEVRDRAGRRRALKLVRPEALADPGDVVERGAQLRRIDHPALVRVHRSGIIERGDLRGWGYLEMDFVDGVPLDRAVEPLPLARLRPLAEALDLLHVGAWSDGLPLVHRDVKPANLVQRPGGEVVLVDPSTLRGMDAGTMTRIGTPVFAAPEVFRGRAGPAADVYAFAATMVALRTGATGEALEGLLTEPERLDAPEGLRLALSPRPGDRPVSCRAVLDEAAHLRPATLRLEGASPTVVLSPFDEDGERVGAGDGHDRGRGAGGEEAGADEVPAPWGWLLVLAMVLAVPIAGWGIWGTGERFGIALGIAVALHLAAHLAGRAPLRLALLLPPLGWARLLADRCVWSRWAEATLSGVLLAGTVAGMYAAVAEGRGALAVGRPAVALAAGLTLFLAAAVLASASTGGALGWIGRGLLTPLWMAGLLPAALARAVAPLPEASEAAEDGMMRDADDDEESE